MPDPSPGYGRFTFERGNPRTLDPFAVECSGCGAHIDVHAGYRCQGAAPDLCLCIFCEGCRQACHSCALPVCGEHVTDLSGEKMCASCVALMVEEAARELAEELEVV